MDFRTLGPLEIVDDGRVLRLGSGRQLSLVALLVINANEAVSVDRIVDELWGGSPPPTAAKIVRNSVSVLRRELGDRLVTAPPGYLLRIEDGELDSNRLARAIDGRDAAALEEALGLWRGRPLAQVAYEPFAQGEIARLEELRLAAHEELLDARLEQGASGSVIPELEALVRQHPLRERLSGQLMLALYRSGRQAEALEAYRRIRRRLDDELGIEPGPALKELERRILNQDDTLGGPPPREPPAVESRRRSLGLVAAAGVLAAIALAAFVVTRDSGGGLAGVDPNYVGVIDPDGNVIVAAIPVGVRPGAVAAGDGSVWVGSLGDRNLTQIDARRRTPLRAVSLDDRTPTGLAVGRGGVWIVHGFTGELSRVDPQFGRVTRTTLVTDAQFAASGGIAVDSRRVWVAYGDSVLARVHRRSLRVSGTTLAGAIPSAVAVVDGDVWVANSGSATVQRFDDVTFEAGPLRTINVGNGPSAVAFGSGALWVANRGDDTVTRIDPSTGATATIRVGEEPVAIAAGAGAVWVANTGDGTVSRIDPSTREVVDTIELGSAPAGIVVAEGLVWVAAQAA